MKNAPKPWSYFFLVYWAIAAIYLYRSWTSDPKQFFDAFGFYLVSTFMGAIIVVLREQRNLMGYVKKTYLKKWEELTTVPIFGMGPGGVNSFRALNFG